MQQVFFYGLFMDASSLAESGFSPGESRKAQLDNYRLVVGDRAALIPETGATCYGMVIGMTERELKELYSAPGVAAYEASEIEITLMDTGESESVLVYNLPVARISDSGDRAYCEQLASVLRDLGFPDAYAAAIEAGD